jgi:hypothetical protein
VEVLTGVAGYNGAFGKVPRPTLYDNTSWQWRGILGDGVPSACGRSASGGRITSLLTDPGKGNEKGKVRD